MGLRSMVRTVLQGKAEVSQRHKRFQRMVDKLVRQPHMRLTQMEDIGGCRVVAVGPREVELMRDRIRVNWGSDIRAEQDYVTAPKRDGYRAIHVIVKRADHLVEIQLRTQRQHWWAKSVEVLESRSGSTLRGDATDAAAMDTLRTMSELLARVDSQETPAPAELQAANRQWQDLMRRLRF
jgi:ppGpp synthetase/RelA/SpoT-type nucleotidyltranferase